MIEARVVELAAPRTLAWRIERLDPAGVGASQVLCESLVSVISPGTELAAYAGLPPLRPGPAYPRLQGYCNVARVLAAGAQVRSVQPGDRVLTFSSHRSHFVAGEEQVLAVLPAEADAAEAACAYLFHLGYNAVLRAGVRPGSRVLVIGCGVLGLASTALAAKAGADVVTVTDHAAAAARAFGAHAAFARSESPAIDGALRGEGADVVIATTNGWADWALALEHAGPRGTIAVLGFPGRSEAPGAFNPLDSRTFYDKQLRIEAMGHSPQHPDERGFARFNERANLRWLVGQIAAGRLPARQLLSGQFAGSDIATAYESLLARRGSPITYALLWKP